MFVFIFENFKDFIIRVCSTLLDYEYGLETTNADNVTVVSSGTQFSSQQCFISQFEDPQEPGIKKPSYTCYCDDSVGCNRGNPMLISNEAFFFLFYVFSLSF